jgi:Rho-binding antiterminator
MNKYIPISCNFYDELEALATLGKSAHIHYLDDDENKVCLEGKIKDFILKEKVEFMVTTNDVLIRLDKLVSVNDLILSEWSNCSAGSK